MLAVLDDDRFADKAPEQVWAVLLDDGRYLCSVSTMYRILRAHNQIRERRAQASHPPRVIPELVASGPDQVFSWDITKLKGPTKGCYYDAYVIMDIYSRKIIHCEVHDGESGPLARDFLTNAIRANAGAVPRYVHSDNGTSMTSKTVAGLLADCHITRSLSRPHTSNDNPYSEAMFKTVKYCPAFPDRFGSLHDARQFMATFVALLQPPPPPLRHRPTHPRQRPRRHLARHPSPAPGRPRRGLPRPSRTIPQRPTDHPDRAQEGLDQQAQDNHRDEHRTHTLLQPLDVSHTLTTSARSSPPTAH